MLKYDIEKITLSIENSELLRINVDVIDKLKLAILKHLSGASRSTDVDRDEDEAKSSFVILLDMALRYALEPGLVASRLGFSLSTVHRCSRGTFVPPQKFVRDAALNGILIMLDEQRSTLDSSGHRSPEPRPVSDDLVPKLITSLKEATSDLAGERVGATVIKMSSGPSKGRSPSRGVGGAVGGRVRRETADAGT